MIKTINDYTNKIKKADYKFTTKLYKLKEQYKKEIEKANEELYSKEE